jgi:hypothetical protein
MYSLIRNWRNGAVQEETPVRPTSFFTQLDFNPPVFFRFISFPIRATLYRQQWAMPPTIQHDSSCDSVALAHLSVLRSTAVSLQYRRLYKRLWIFLSSKRSSAAARRSGDEKYKIYRIINHRVLYPPLTNRNGIGLKTASERASIINIIFNTRQTPISITFYGAW